MLASHVARRMKEEKEDETRDHTAMVHSQDEDSVNTGRLFFLDVGWMLAASKESIQFHMVSYYSAIKAVIL